MRGVGIRSFLVGAGTVSGFLSRMDSQLSETLNSGLVYTAPFALLTETGLC